MSKTEEMESAHLDWQYTDLVSVHESGLVMYYDGHLHNGDPFYVEIWALAPDELPRDDLRPVARYRVALIYRNRRFSHYAERMTDAESVAVTLPALLNWLGSLPYCLKED